MYNPRPRRRHKTLNSQSKKGLSTIFQSSLPYNAVVRTLRLAYIQYQNNSVTGVRGRENVALSKQDYPHWQPSPGNVGDWLWRERASVTIKALKTKCRKTKSWVRLQRNEEVSVFWGGREFTFFTLRPFSTSFCRSLSDEREHSERETKTSKRKESTRNWPNSSCVSRTNVCKTFLIIRWSQKRIISQWQRFPLNKKRNWNCMWMRLFTRIR